FDQPNLGNLAQSIMTAAAHDAIGASSYWETLTRVGNALSEAEGGRLEKLYHAGMEAVSTPLTVATGRPMAATVARGMDPTEKITGHWDTVNDALNNLVQNIPFYRKGVPSKIDIFTGEEKKLPAPWGASWLGPAAGIFTPGASSPVEKDPVWKLIQDSGAKIPNFRRPLGAQPQVTGAAPEPGEAPPVSLTDEEMNKLMIQFGKRKFDGNQTLRDFILEQSKDPQFKEATRTNKARMLEGWMRANNNGAFRELQAK